jgi:hypothetical protein
MLPVNFEADIIELYPRIPWELIVGSLGFPEHTLGTTDLQHDKGYI